MGEQFKFTKQLLETKLLYALRSTNTRPKVKLLMRLGEFELDLLVVILSWT